MHKPLVSAAACAQAAVAAQAAQGCGWLPRGLGGAPVRRGGAGELSCGGEDDQKRRGPRKRARSPERCGRGRTMGVGQMGRGGKERTVDAGLTGRTLGHLAHGVSRGTRRLLTRLPLQPGAKTSGRKASAKTDRAERWRAGRASPGRVPGDAFRRGWAVQSWARRGVGWGGPGGESPVHRGDGCGCAAVPSPLHLRAYVSAAFQKQKVWGARHALEVATRLLCSLPRCSGRRGPGRRRPWPLPADIHPSNARAHGFERPSASQRGAGASLACTRTSAASAQRLGILFY